MKVVVFGTGDYARMARVYLTSDSEHEVVAFTVDADYQDRQELLELPVVPFESIPERYPPTDFAMLVAIGFRRVNRARAEVYQRCKAAGYAFISYVNSRAYRFGPVEIGENTFIFEANVLQPFVRIGDNTVLWSGNHIGHDSTIGSNCFIASHVVVSGNCTIGNNCFVGVNATFRDGIKVADDCVIGAGATIMKNTEPGGVYSVRSTEPFPKKSWELSNF